MSFDEAFGEPAELAGATAADVESFCEALRARIREVTGLVASVGAGSGKQIAKIASGLAKPDGIRVVRRDEERVLLDGLPVRRLWGIGPVAEEKLHRLGIDTIGALAALSDAEAANILGGTVGPALHQLARGIDDRPVAENGPAKQISAESTFPEDLTTLDQLREAVGSIGDHAHTRLVKDGRGARTVTVKLKKSDMSILTRSATLPYATTDAATLIAIARRLLLDPIEVGPIRLVGVGFSGLSDVRQESLFPDLELMAEEVSDTGLPQTLSQAAERGAGLADRRRRRAHRLRARLAAGRRARGDDRAFRDPRHRPRAGPHASATTPRTSNGPTPSTAWTGPTTSTPSPRTQPQRATTSSTGEPLARAAISSTRACGGRSRGTITAPASDQLAARAVAGADRSAGHPRRHRNRHAVAAVPPHRVDHLGARIARTECLQHKPRAPAATHASIATASAPG